VALVSSQQTNSGPPCHAQLVAVTNRMIWFVAFSVEVVLPSLVQYAGEAGLLKIAYSGFDIAVMLSHHPMQPSVWYSMCGMSAVCY